MANIDQIIEDLIKGASRAGAKVEMHDGKGRETKIASVERHIPAKQAALGTAYVQGANAAVQRYKVGFLGSLAAKLGPKAVGAAKFVGTNIGLPMAAQAGMNALSGPPA